MAKDKEGSDLPRGVCYDKRSKDNPYKAQLSFKGKHVHIAYYATPAIASTAVESKRLELGLVDQERDMPRGVSFNKGKKSKSKPYHARFSHEGKQVNVGHYPTPDIAFEAVNNKRGKLKLPLYEWSGTTPQGVTPLPEKEERALPMGVTFDKGSKSKPYRATFRHQGKTVNVGNYPTPDIAFEAVNNKRRKLKLPPYEWSGTTPKAVPPPSLPTPPAEPANKKRKKSHTSPSNGASSSSSCCSSSSSSPGGSRSGSGVPAQGEDSFFSVIELCAPRHSLMQDV